MLITATELIARARAHTDSDEVAVKQWIPDPTWLFWANREVPRVYRAMLRAGLVAIEPQRTQLSNVAQPWIIGEVAPDEPREVLAICGVTEETGGVRRVLRCSMPGDGLPMPSPSTTSGSARTWSAYWDGGTAFASRFRIRTHPVPTTGDYFGYWIPRPLRLVTSGASLASGTSLSVDFPGGMEELVVLRMARSAFARSREAPQSVTRMLQEFETELETAASLVTQRDQARARNTDRANRGWVRRGQDVEPDVFDQTNWWWAP